MYAVIDDGVNSDDTLRGSRTCKLQTANAQTFLVIDRTTERC